MGIFNVKKGGDPLAELLPDGGYTAIFRRIACVGDSLSSGEFETVAEDGRHSFHDVYEYSWGQYLARMTGATVYNFSCGGMTARMYCESYAEENGFWDAGKACQAYIIALGVNDCLNLGGEVGSVEDVDFSDPENNKKTFAGYYAKIIQKYRALQPYARFFLVTMPKDSYHDNEHLRKVKAEAAALLHAFAEKFPYTYVIDLYAHAPDYDTSFYEKFGLNGHLTPAGYLLTAKMIGTYIDYIIRSDLPAFKQVGLIERPEYYDPALDGEKGAQK